MGSSWTPDPLHWEHRVLATGLWGNSLKQLMIKRIRKKISSSSIPCAHPTQPLQTQALVHLSVPVQTFLHELRTDVHVNTSIVVFCMHLPCYNVVQLPSDVRLFATLWTATCQASLSLTISWSLPRFMFIAWVMSSRHLILWRPLLLLPSIFPSTGDFSNVSSVHIRWPEYWSFSFSISPSSRRIALP